VGIKEVGIKLAETHENKYVSEDLYMLWNDKEELDKDDEGNFFKFIKGNKTRVFPLNKTANFNEKLQIKIDNKIKEIGVFEKLGYSIYKLNAYDRWSDGYFQKQLNSFTIANKYLADFDCFPVVDKSPTETFVYDFLKKNKVRFFNVLSHGVLADKNDPKSANIVIGYSPEIVEKKEKVTYFVNDGLISPREVEEKGVLGCNFIFLNCCDIGNKESLKEWKKAFDAKGILGFEGNVFEPYTVQYMLRFYRILAEYKQEGKTITLEDLKKMTEESFGVPWILHKKEANIEVDKDFKF